MSRTKNALAIVATVATLTFGGASAAEASPWEFAGSYPTQPECNSAGDSGAAAGTWEAYRCTLFEGQYDLYVR
jgi:hypothetical protein